MATGMEVILHVPVSLYKCIILITCVTPKWREANLGVISITRTEHQMQLSYHILQLKDRHYATA